MSERRMARGRTLQVSADEKPACLAVGRLVEVWAADLTAGPRHVSVLASAKRRFDGVRLWWLDQAGITGADAWSAIPSSRPWSITEPAVRESHDVSEEQVPALRREADALLVRAGEIDG